MANLDIKELIKIPYSCSPTSSPDGKNVAYLNNISGTPQIWISDENGTHRQITNYLERVALVSWSPNGEWILFAIDKGGDENFQIKLIDASDHSRIISLTDDTNIRNDFGGWSNDGNTVVYSSNKRDLGYFDLYTHSINGSSKLIHQTGDNIHNVSFKAFSNNQKFILFTEERTNRYQYLKLLDIETGEINQISNNDLMGGFGDAFFNDEDNEITIITNEGKDFSGIATIDLSDNKLNYIYCAEHEVEFIKRDKSNNRIFFYINEQGYSKLGLLDLSNHDFNLFDNPKEVTFMEPGWAWSLCILDKSNILFTINATNQNPEIIKFDLNSQKYEFFKKSYEGNIKLNDLPSPSLHTFNTFDNRDIPFFFLKPKDFKKGEDNPVLILIHGGPEGQERPAFKPQLQYLASRGIGILLPNVRGSGGYGEAYGHLDDTYKRMDSVKDIEYLWKWVVDSGWASKDKIAVMGGSYGGFMTLACITEYPDLWAAAVELYGMVNMVTFFERTASYRAQHRAYEYGDPIKDRKLLEDISAIHKIDNITTPLLVLHGDEDPRVPMHETEQLVSELKEAGKPVDFVRFSDEGHGFVKEENRIIADTAIAEFLTKYLLG
tara:strand:- start:900 stop:2717 length:1818 start_codon:yes stop_codon:yes gene_type:complete